ncbi:hypothetical protein FHU29_003826 [Hoyosella altamirensis]|uniref:Uncharacterized protein n=1 Tax=Hoyosella altamirensis TaxID=616997 RepID=A0A839RSM7_9ACTN|nr:hypothetical protein [Hoyosella altamirensis]
MRNRPLLTIGALIIVLLILVFLGPWVYINLIRG